MASSTVEAKEAELAQLRELKTTSASLVSYLEQMAQRFKELNEGTEGVLMHHFLRALHQNHVLPQPVSPGGSVFTVRDSCFWRADAVERAILVGSFTRRCWSGLGPGGPAAAKDREGGRDVDQTARE